ncbi:hypothetical protein FQN49_003732, partial [Arthroderma sp. PD_2]
MAYEELQALIRDLHQTLDQKHVDKTAALLSRAKRALLQLNALIPSNSTPHQLISLAREVLEL